MLIKKRQFLTATLVVALAAAVFVNWYYTDPTKSYQQNQQVTANEENLNLGDSLYVAGTTAAAVDESTNEQEYFAKARLNRENAHDEIIDSIKEIIEQQSLNEDDRKQISDSLEKFQSDVKSEADTENLITAKTGFDCVVVINDKSCQVIMQKNSLDDAVVLQITEIISKNTDISAENLTIIEVK